MAPKSIYRRAGVQHFQLVHRSQRDPLIHDPKASSHVLKPFHRENEVKKGKSRVDLESLLTSEELAGRPNVGEASLYGVYYDDTEYDYMQHLRETGVQEDGVETIMIEAPSSRKQKSRPGAIELRLPAEALPSTSELSKSQAYDAQQSVPDALAGFQPNMDPHLRQVLEALEEDAFVDEDLADDFFGELIQDGERTGDDFVEFEFREEGIGGEEPGEETIGPDRDEPWGTRLAHFKKQEDVLSEADASEVDGYVESADTISGLPVIDGKRRRRGAGSESSGFSMSSSAIFRNEGLTTLDERYDRVESFYDEDEDIPHDDENDSESDDAPDLLEAREDFEAVMDDFLASYELVGRRMQPVLHGNTASEKLGTIRRALGSVHLDDGSDDDGISTPMPHDIDTPKERWDCETILSTHTNLENHPRLIKVREDKSVPRIHLNPRTGLPSAVRHENEPRHGIDAPERGEGVQPGRVTVSRPRDESREDKKARKQAVKEERQARRAEKKTTREQFSTERKHQVMLQANPTKIRINDAML